MTVIYKFTSLAALADHFDAHASRLRDNAKITGTPAQGFTKTRRMQLLAEASAHESCAHVVRNTIIEEPKQ